MTATPGYTAPQAQPVSPEERKARIQCTSSLVLGIIGLILAWTPVLGLLFGIVGAVMSVRGRKGLMYSRAHNGIGVGGLVTSTIAIVIGTLTTLVWLLAIIGIAWNVDWLTTPFRGGQGGQTGQ